MTQRLRGSTAATAAGALVVAVVLGFVLAGHRDAFSQALRQAPIWVLLNTDEVLETIPVQEWDRRVDVIITPEQMITCEPPVLMA